MQYSIVKFEIGCTRKTSVADVLVASVCGMGACLHYGRGMLINNDIFYNWYRLLLLSFPTYSTFYNMKPNKQENQKQKLTQINKRQFIKNPSKLSHSKNKNIFVPQVDIEGSYRICEVCTWRARVENRGCVGVCYKAAKILLSRHTPPPATAMNTRVSASLV